jgi:pyruvate kinase
MINIDRKTKIIATLGPASNSPENIRLLANTGVDVFRLNFSHSDYASAERVIVSIRTISKELGRPLGVFIDLQGPKIRIGKFKEGHIVITEGAPFTLTAEPVLGDETIVSVNLKEIIQDAEVGNQILLDDGKVRLIVTKKDEHHLYTTVKVGGPLSNHKGINLPGMKLSISSLTPKDREDVLFGIKQKVDYFALSFVRRAEDISELRSILEEHNSDIKIIAKIEKPEALDVLQDIIDATDAVMVARGDLGVEIPMEKVPTIQKDIIRKTNYGGKPVIVATQMLESMITSIMPTRAEVSDVATAIYDWADAVMLSGETAVGKYPFDAVDVMSKVATDVDVSQSERKRKLVTRKTQFIQEESLLSSLCDSADELADEIGATAIITFSDSGRTALMLSKYRSSVPIVAITDKPAVCTRMTLFRGTWPILASRTFQEMTGIKDMLEEAEKRTLEQGLVKKGDMVVMMAGIPIATAGSTNMIRVHQIGEPF